MSIGADGAGVTRRQAAILERLRELAAAGEPPPTLDELCQALGLRSRGSLHQQVKSLVDAGLVEPMRGKQRGVRLRERALPPPLQLPLLGTIAAGRPIEALANPEPIEVPSHLRSQRDCYVLQVRGDSMIDDGILDGDWVVVERRDHARDGEIVVALIDGQEATLKRIRQRPGEVTLIPANGSIAPIVVEPDRVTIQGVVVGQMRAYR
ncbi:MAG: transcriptional repressor LexA [Chromatiales bacterium]|nr:transcriptional repressor LexA [Chromatiales bacterium]